MHNAITRLICIVAGFGAIATPSSAQEAKDMALVGAHDLQARSAYQPTIHLQSGRWIAYIGHHGGTQEEPKPLNPLTGAQEFNGTSLLDARHKQLRGTSPLAVPDPRQPKLLAPLPGDQGLAEQGGAQMVRVCDGKSLPKADAGAVYMLRTFGNSAQEIWNTADPSHPKL